MLTHHALKCQNLINRKLSKFESVPSEQKDNARKKKTQNKVCLFFLSSRFRHVTVQARMTGLPQSKPTRGGRPPSLLPLQRMGSWHCPAKRSHPPRKRPLSAAAAARYSTTGCESNNGPFSVFVQASEKSTSPQRLVGARKACHPMR